MFKSVVAATLAFFLFAVAVVAQETPPNPLPDVLNVRVSTTPERARLVLDLQQGTQFAIASLDNPSRIAIDVRASGLDFTETTPVAGEGLVQSYTVQMAEAGRARTELVLSAPAQVQQAYVLDPFADQPARLVVDLIPATPEQFAANVAKDLQASLANEDPEQPVVATPTQPGGSNIESKTRPLIVLDPGHGGVDSGARGPQGVMEKDIVLSFAHKLQDLLIASGRFDVALTREDDSFLSLEARVALARQNKADLFISIHADSFQDPTVRGLSIYTRDENATDSLDRVLAEHENKSDIIAGLTPPEMANSVVDLLVDLMRREMRRQSYLSAQAIVHQLEPSVELRKFPVRQANFLVLQAPDVPSILMELGFLSNGDDIDNLEAANWQDRTAEAVARGISTYFDELQNPPPAEASAAH
ncbi:MAG TPA: N-acetylmuramoyl-L-alanine amidase [Devosiaceae bacterium]